MGRVKGHPLSLKGVASPPIHSPSLVLLHGDIDRVTATDRGGPRVRRGRGGARRGGQDRHRQLA